MGLVGGILPISNTKTTPVDLDTELKTINTQLTTSQIIWLDQNKPPELSRAGFIRTIIRHAMTRQELQLDAYESQINRS
tara:strand:+ start:478 stop:714 length:237 start_codon:yes stop_codon:yes gene_type:complete